ncbi:MAG: hypothetical protein ACLP9Y_15780 [Mycobacterium sp.]
MRASPACRCAAVTDTFAETLVPKPFPVHGPDAMHCTQIWAFVRCVGYRQINPGKRATDEVYTDNAEHGED